MWIQRKNKKIHICIYIIKIDNMQHIYNNTKKKKKKFFFIGILANG